MPEVTGSLDAADLPALYRVADAAATSAQRRFHSLIRAQIAFAFLGLVLSIPAARIDDFTPQRLLLGVLPALVVLLRLLQRTSGVEPLWYSTRAAAESVKALAWSYSMRSQVFATDDEHAAEAAFLQQLEAIAQDLDPSALAAVGVDEITPAMRALRAATPGARHGRYVRERLDDQIAWYERRARDAARALRRWDRGFEAMSFAAVGIVVVGAERWSNSADATAIAGGVAASIIAWTGVRRYGTSSRTYANVAFQLKLLRLQADGVDPATDGWSRLVEQAEELLAREHSMWRAARM